MLLRNQAQRQLAYKFSERLLGPMVCSLLALIFGTASAQQLETPKATGDPKPLSLTIEQAIDEAIQNNMGLLAERMSLTVAEASLITARLRPNPVFSFSSVYLGPDLLNLNVGNGNPPEVDLRVDVPIERGRKRQLRIETAQYARQIAEARLLDAIRKLRQDVTLACIDVIHAKANLALASDNLRTLEELVRINELRVNAGSIAPVELTRSQVAMLQFRGNVKRAELELLTAKTKLQNLLGRKTHSDGFDVIGELKVQPLNSEFELARLQQIALEARPDVRALELAQARSQSELRLQLANAKVDYIWGVQYARLAGVGQRSNTLGFFFSIPIPLYNRNQGEIARVRAEQEQLARQAQALKAQVLTEVKIAYQEFLSASELVKSIERDLLRPARQSRDISAYTYRAGASSLIEFLDAQRAFNETMQSYYEAQAAYRRAVTRLNAAIGREVIR